MIELSQQTSKNNYNKNMMIQIQSSNYHKNKQSISISMAHARVYILISMVVLIGIVLFRITMEWYAFSDDDEGRKDINQIQLQQINDDNHGHNNNNNKISEISPVEPNISKVLEYEDKASHSFNKNPTQKNKNENVFVEVADKDTIPRDNNNGEDEGVVAVADDLVTSAPTVKRNILKEEEEQEVEDDDSWQHKNDQQQQTTPIENGKLICNNIKESSDYKQSLMMPLVSKSQIGYDIVNNSTSFNCQAKFIIAGSRKGGSSSLYRYLISHPLVDGPIESEEKRNGPRSGEIFYFNSCKNAERCSSRRYNKYFPAPEPGMKYIEASIAYMPVSWIAQRIADICGKDMDFVFLVREPVSRIESQFLMRLRLGSDQVYPETVADDVINAAVKKYLEHPDEPKPHDFIRCGIYYLHIRNFIKVFGSNRVHVIFSEDLLANPAPIVTKLLNNVLKVDASLMDVDKVTKEKFNAGETGSASSKSSKDVHITRSSKGYWPPDPHHHLSKNLTYYLNKAIYQRHNELLAKQMVRSANGDLLRYVPLNRLVETGNPLPKSWAGSGDITILKTRTPIIKPYLGKVLDIRVAITLHPRIFNSPKLAAECAHNLTVAAAKASNEKVFTARVTLVVGVWSGLGKFERGDYPPDGFLEKLEIEISKLASKDSIGSEFMALKYGADPIKFFTDQSMKSTGVFLAVDVETACTYPNEVIRFAINFSPAPLAITPSLSPSDTFAILFGKYFKRSAIQLKTQQEIEESKNIDQKQVKIKKSLKSQIENDENDRIIYDFLDRHDLKLTWYFTDNIDVVNPCEYFGPPFASCCK